MMSNKRGRKCSIKTCDNFQHSNKQLSFFRFPKDVERCRTWIEKTKRFDLLDKINIHDERICQQHFESIMFLNESQNRLQQYAIPSLYLTTKPPQIQPHLVNDFMLNDFHGDKHFNNAIVDTAAALLYQNNLTITPVYSKPKIIQNESFSQPINLSISHKNGMQSIDKTNIFNVSSSSDGSSNNSLHISENNFINGKNIAPIHNANGNIISSSNTISTTTSITNGNFRRPRQVFTFEQENQLADYVRETSNYYSGLSSKEVRIMAFVYGVCNQVEMPNGWHESHQASFDWCVGFIKRTKLPPQMITGISTKGSNKQFKLTTTNETKSNKILPQLNRNSIKHDENTNNTPIETD